MSVIEQAEAVVDAATKQSTEREAFDILAYERGIMRILLGWGVGSMFYGLFRLGAEDAETRGAAQQHIAWGAIDALLAVNGWRGNQQKQQDLDNDSLLPYRLERHANFLEKVLWFNFGLDFLYLLWGNTWRQDERPRRKGWGKAIMIQGGFLLLFDGIAAYVLGKRKRG